MKKKFVLIALVAILGLPSCDKIYDEIAALNDRVTELEDTTIAAINEQISNINTSISYLEVVDTELNGYIKTLQEVSAKLQNDIEAVDTRLSEVQTSMENQMSAMKTELDSDILTTQADLLAQLQSLKAELEAELEQINATILVLKSKDDELEKNISALRSYVDDELSKTADWVAATYSTLDQYELLCTDIATIKAQIETLNSSLVELETRLNDKISTDIATAVEILNANMDTAIDGLYAEISSQITAVTTAYTSAITSAKEEVTAAYTTEIATAVTNLEASMKLWVNEQLANYYTIAQVDAMLVAMCEEFEGKLSSQKIYLESLISSLSDVLLAKISTNGDLIAALRNDITSLDAEVAKNAEAIVANAEKIAANANAIRANTEDIIENSKRIEANAEQIDSNAILSAEKIEEATAVLTQKIEANTVLINENRQLIGDVDTKIDNTNLANAKAIAENAKAIAEQAELIAKNSVAISNNATAIATNSVEIENIKKQIISVKDEITKAYTELIETSIETLEGKLDNAVLEINSRISNEVKSINVAIETLETRVEAVEKEIAALKEIITSIQGDIAIIQDQISALISRIQSVTYIPEYSDGKATVKTVDEESAIVAFDFQISPINAVRDIEANWQSVLSVKAVNTVNRAVSFIDMSIFSFKADEETGVISITAIADDLGDGFFTNSYSASAALYISDGNNARSSNFIELVPTIVNNEIWYTAKDKVEVSSRANFGGASVVSNEWHESTGRGIISFDEDVNMLLGSIFNFENTSKARLKSVAIPRSVTEIDEYAFTSSGPWLEKFTGKFVSEDGRCLVVDGKVVAFAPYGLTSYKIPNNVISIPTSVFEQHINIQSITIPKSVEEISCGAFYGTYAMFKGKFASKDGCCLVVNGELVAFTIGVSESYTLPDDVEYINLAPLCVNLDGDAKLESITIPNSVKYVHSQVFDYNSLKEFRGKYASEDGCCLIIDGKLVGFVGDCGLTEYTIPDNVNTINCSFSADLENIIIPSTVKEIDYFGFWNMNNLSNLIGLYCESIIPPTLGFVAYNTLLDGNFNIYVPMESVYLYQSTDMWCEVADRICGYDFD